MTFAIDTGAPIWEPVVHASGIDGAISYRSRGADAERVHRKIICNIQEFDDAADLDAYHEAESLIIDSLWLDYPQYAEAIDTAYEDHRCMLTGVYRTKKQLSARTGLPVGVEPPRDGIAYSSAPNGQNDKGKSNMNAFTNFDNGPGGSEGPWLGWSARGAQDGSVPPKSFFLRDQNVRSEFDLSQGIVMDVDNMKTGWCYSAGVAGQAPDWKWNPSISSFMPKPGDDYRKGLQIRCAIGDGKTATWEDAGAGAWNAFADGLVPQLQQGPGDGSLPVVRMTGSRDERYARGGTSIPLLEVVKWVPRPDCLKEGASAGVATDPTPQPAPQPAAASGGEF